MLGKSLIRMIKKIGEFPNLISQIDGLIDSQESDKLSRLKELIAEELK